MKVTEYFEKKNEKQTRTTEMSNRAVIMKRPFDNAYTPFKFKINKTKQK